MLEQVSVNKSMVFSLRKSDVQVNGEVISTDAVPFVVDGMWMVTDEILCRGDKHEGRVECRKSHCLCLW